MVSLPVLRGRVCRHLARTISTRCQRFKTNKHNEPQETADLLRSASTFGILNCTTSKSTTTLAACARMVPLAPPTFRKWKARTQTPAAITDACFAQGTKMSTLGQHPSQQDAKVQNQTKVTARNSAERRVPKLSLSKSTEQITSPEALSDLFRIQLYERDVANQGRGEMVNITWKRDGSNSIGKKFFKRTLKVATSSHFQPNRTAESCTHQLRQNRQVEKPMSSSSRRGAFRCQTANTNPATHNRRRRNAIDKKRVRLEQLHGTTQSSSSLPLESHNTAITQRCNESWYQLNRP